MIVFPFLSFSFFPPGLSLSLLGVSQRGGFFAFSSLRTYVYPTSTLNLSLCTTNNNNHALGGGAKKRGLCNMTDGSTCGPEGVSLGLNLLRGLSLLPRNNVWCITTTGTSYKREDKYSSRWTIVRRLEGSR